MTEDFVHHLKPSDQYNRLLTAFGLKQTPEINRTHLTTLSEGLGVRMSALSDCIRKGIVTGPVLEAARAKGINPEYITSGILPIRPDESAHE